MLLSILLIMHKYCATYHTTHHCKYLVCILSYLNNCQLQIDHVKELTPLLSAQLIKLSVANDGMDAISLQYIFNDLMSNQILLSLKLSHNRIALQTAKSLAILLAYNHSIIQIDLEATQLGDKDTITIFNSLIKNTTMQRINVQNNQFTNQSANSISSYISASTTIKYISMHHTHTLALIP